jgi:hypothetical protein
MKLVGSLAVALVGCFAAPHPVLARWDSKQDNKSESTLQALTDKGLFSEAFDVCVRRAMIEHQANDTPELVGPATTDATDYLGVIDQVAGKKNGGVAPSWMLDLTAAHTVKKCQSAFRSFLAAESPHEPQQPRKTTTPHVAKKAAAKRNGDRLEQLPPWLAPPHQD